MKANCKAIVSPLRQAARVDTCHSRFIQGTSAVMQSAGVCMMGQDSENYSLGLFSKEIICRDFSGEHMFLSEPY